MVPATILVVDDEPSACSAMASILKGAGYDVLMASDGQRALDQVELSPPDLILSDLCMPNMGGLELLRRLKCQSVAAPVILMTASSAVDSAVGAMREGAAD